MVPVRVVRLHVCPAEIGVRRFRQIHTRRDLRSAVRVAVPLTPSAYARRSLLRCR